MSELLSSVKKAFHNVIDFLKEVSVRAPGSTTSQVVIVGGLAGSLVYFLIAKRSRLPPGPFSVPFLGNVFALLKKEPLYVTLDRWAAENYGPVITLQLGPMRCVTLNRLDVVLEALVEKGEDFAGRLQVCSLGVQTEGFRDITFTNDTTTWRLHKKIAARALRRYLESEQLDRVVQHVVGIVTDEMAEEEDAFNPRPYISTLVFHLLDTLCFGKVKEFDDPSIQRVSCLYDILSREIGSGFLEDVLPFVRRFPTRKFQRFSELMGQFLDYIHLQVDEHRESFSSEFVGDVVECLLLVEREMGGEKKGKEVMAVFTPTHVGQTISDIFGGGVDTSRLTLNWALLFMAGYPEEQARVQAEIDDVTGMRWPASSDRLKLVYTEATLYEIMRLGTAVPLGMPHKTRRDTTLRGYDIPANTMVVVNHWALLRDPDKWDSAEEFRPSRFIDVRGSLKTELDSWLPFSIGSRACLGEPLAKLQLLLVFACLLKRFSFSLPSGVEFDSSPSCEGLIAHAPKPFDIVVTER